MTKFFIILIVAAVIESIGVAFLSAGLKQAPSLKEISVSEILKVVKTCITNGKIVLGVALEAVFFGFLLYMLSQRDVSFVWPLTSLGFIFTALAGRFILNEQVSVWRWAGVFLIAFGAAITSYGEAEKDAKAAKAPVQASNLTDLRPQ